MRTFYKVASNKEKWWTTENEGQQKESFIIMSSNHPCNAAL
jgi:hypothetical protein